MDFLYILLAIVILLVMIVIHELGHYLAGKLLKFKINEFAIGFGPKLIYKKKKNGEVFSLRAFPLGGFCAFEGEDMLSEKNRESTAFKELSSPSESGDSDLKPFDKQEPWKRIVVLSAGAAFNLISAVLFSFIFIAVAGYGLPRIDNLYATDNQAVLKQNDIILAVDGREISIMNDLSSLLADTQTGDEVVLTILRNEVEQEITVKKQEYRIIQVQDNSSHSDLLQRADIIISVNGKTVGKDFGLKEMLAEVDKGDLALVVARFDEEKLKTININVNITANAFNAFFKEATVEIEASGVGISVLYERQKGGVMYGIKYAVPYTVKMSWMLLDYFGKLLTGRIAFKGSLSGPITTISIIASESQKNSLSILAFMPLIAANLGIFNLFPIPAMDGSKIVFCIIEWIRKKPINKEIEAWIHFGGLVFLLGLVILVELLNFSMLAG